MNIAGIRLRPDETPEEFFEESVEIQEGVPFPVQPYEEMKRRYERVRFGLKQGQGFADIDFFCMFHRRDGFFCLQHKDGTRMIDVGAINVENIIDDLDQLYEQYPESLGKDTYFTVNSYYRTLGNNSRSPLPHSARKEFNLRWLNACYVDIDVGRSPSPDDKEIDFPKYFTWEQALLQVMILEAEEILPPASIYARSGRGIYVFWLLDPVKFHYAKPWILENYKACNRELNDIVRGEFLKCGLSGFINPNSLPLLLPADPLATDGARILRVAGSVHSKTGNKVYYYPYALAEIDSKEIYTLQQMMDFCHIQDAAPSPASPSVTIFKRAVAPSTVPARANGVRASMKYRLADAEKIFRERLIKKGIRYNSLRTVSLFHLYAGTAEADVVVHLEKLAHFCRPPYPTKGEINDIPVQKIAERTYHDTDKRPFLFNNQVLVKFWRIDKETAKRLKLHVLRPPAAGKLAVVSINEKKIKRRRDALLRLNPEEHSLSELLVMMKRKKYRFSKTTLREDLKTLEELGLIHRTNRKGGRPEKVE